MEGKIEFEELFNKIGSCVAVYEAKDCGNDFIFKDFNKAAEKADKIKRKDVVGKSVLKIFPGIKEFGLFDIFKRVYKTGKPESQAISIYKDKRISGWRENYVYKLRTGEVVAIYNDLTKQKQAVEEIKSLAKFPEENPNIVGRVGYDGKLLYCNHAYKKIFKDGVYIPFKLKDAVKKIAAEKIFDPVDVETETSDRIFLFNLIPIKKESYINFYGRDITKRKETEKNLQENRALLNTVGEIAHIGGWTFDPKTLIQKWTDETFRILEIDLTKGEPKVPEGLDFIVPTFRPMANQAIKRAIESGEPYDQEWEVITAKGNRRWVRAVASVEKEQGKVIKVMGSFQDITERKKVMEALHESEEKYRTLVEKANEAILIVQDGRFVFVNPRAHELMGIPDGDFIGKSFIDFVWVEDREMLAANYRKRLAGGTVPDSYDFRIIGSQGSPLWVFMSVALIQYKGKLATLIMITNINDRKKAEEEILHISFHDSLTGLYNRRFFEEELKRLDTERQLPLSFVIGDMNGLKLVNDIFGHNEGDGLLVKAAEILKKVCRSDDILARWGGDEFVILLPKTSTADTEEILERIVKEFKKTANPKIPMSLSLGASQKETILQDIQAIILDAESNMYRNKLAQKESSASSIISTLEQALFEKSDETREHIDGVRDLAIKLGKSIKLSASQLDEISLLALLHDIGKVAVTETILTKEGKLTIQEWEVIKRHSELGFNIACSSPHIAHIAKAILSCHENWDGSGYPRRIKGQSIPVISRIILIADTYDVMTRGRIYKRAMSKDDAIAELKKYSGTQFDPVLVDKFIEIISS